MIDVFQRASIRIMLLTRTGTASISVVDTRTHADSNQTETLSSSQWAGCIAPTQKSLCKCECGARNNFSTFFRFPSRIQPGLQSNRSPSCVCVTACKRTERGRRASVQSECECECECECQSLPHARFHCRLSASKIWCTCLLHKDPFLTQSITFVWHPPFLRTASTTRSTSYPLLETTGTPRE